jgi:hypothetical protein
LPTPEVRKIEKGERRKEGGGLDCVASPEELAPRLKVEGFHMAIGPSGGCHIAHRQECLCLETLGGVPD